MNCHIVDYILKTILCIIQKYSYTQVKLINGQKVNKY